MRILNVAAFAVSGYASSEGRHCKPFNPLLGETYEADYPEKGIRFFSEKVYIWDLNNFHFLKGTGHFIQAWKEKEHFIQGSLYAILGFPSGFFYFLIHCNIEWVCLGLFV